MARKPNVALRVLGIVCISAVVVLASLLFLLLAACGALKPSGTEWWAPWIIVGGYGTILVGGFYGIFRLAKGIMGAGAAGNEPPPAPPQSLAPAEASKLLEALRLAMAASIGLSLLAMVALRLQAQGRGGPPLSQLPFFVLYQLPFVAAFWLTRRGPERKGIGLAMTFCAVSALYSVWSLGTLLMFYMRANSGFQPYTLISLADIVATGAGAYFAFELWQGGPKSRDDAAVLVGGVVGSILYLAGMQFAHRYVLMRGLGG